MCKKLYFLIVNVGLSFAAANAFGHGGQIEVFVNPDTQRLYVVQTFEPVNLILDPGLEISSHDPGFGVSFASNGLAAETEIGLEVTQGLLYWDGTNVVPTTATVKLENPEFDSDFTPVVSDVIEYPITENTRLQTGMKWGVYPGGSHWDANGTYFLNPLSAVAGVYGAVVRVTSPSYHDSAPFLFPLTYRGHLSQEQVDSGVAAMRLLVEDPLPGDYDGNHVVDSLDYDAWKGLFGIATDLSADGNRNGATDAADYTVWLSQLGASTASGSAAELLIPEPSSGTIVMFGLALFYVFPFCRCHWRWLYL